MELFDAIYARQSVDKTDSISIESQVEFCKREVVDSKTKIYIDKGFSGKNVDRPEFQNLMSDIKAGIVRRVIVYRLDRISRSVLDFSNIIDVLKKYSVDFVSTTEKFDTGTPIGKAMLMIVMIFAQLERETIQKRVVDAYHSRSKRGFYMGGRVPFGFELTNTYIDGIKTKMYSPIESEVQTVRLIFSLYSKAQTSLGDVGRYLQEQKIHNRNGKFFSRSRLRDIIINPVYVKADYKIYDFYKSQGTEIINTPEDFIGTNGAYLYTGDTKTRKSITLEGQTLVLAPHNGLIDSDIWLKCRLKCLNNQSVTKPIKAKSNWLAGKIKCADCGYALNVKAYRCKTKEDNRYYLCSNKYRSGDCNFTSINADIVDKIVLEEITKKLSIFKTLSPQTEESTNPQTVKQKVRIEAIEKEISSLLDKIPSANETLIRYINSRITELDTEKERLHKKIIQNNKTNKKDSNTISGYIEHWEELSIGDKIAVVDCLIDRIDARETKLEIKWKI